MGIQHPQGSADAQLEILSRKSHEKPRAQNEKIWQCVLIGIDPYPYRKISGLEL